MLHGALFLVGQVALVNDMAGLVGTGHGAIATANAEVVIDLNNAVGTNFCRGGGANILAGRLGAMHAPHRHEGALNLGIGAGFHIQDLAPLYSRRGGVGMFAGRRAGLTADAAAQIGDHHITGHAPPSRRLTATRTISAEEPVESVNARDMGTTVFMLGAGLSFE